MKKLILLILMLILALPSCSTASKHPLSYQSGSLSAEVTLEKNGARISAVIRLGPESESSPRDAEISFSSPEGLRVIRKNGVCSAELGGVSVSPDPKLFLLCDLFSLHGDIISVKAREIVVSVGQEQYTVCFNANDNPTRILGEDLTLDILWIESEK